MIPKIIHYAWFGRNPKSELIRKCIASWSKYNPDYKIIEWNEDNYNVNSIPYVSEAYKQKKWAFVADYAKFDILNQYGGIILDTDVEFLKPLPDNMLESEAFCAFECSRGVAPGLIYASEPHQRILEQVIEEYKGRSFSTNNTVGDITTAILKQNGLVIIDSFQKINGVDVYPNEYFCAFDHETQHFTITDNTVSIHHYTASWSNWKRKAHFKMIWLLAELLGPSTYLKLKHKFYHPKKD